MAKIDYPNELTPAYWDKKKPVLAKTKKTGIGEALTTLKKAHNGVDWEALEPHPTTENIDSRLEEWPKKFSKDFKPIADLAKDVQKLAKKWSSEFTKEKLIPKSAAAAADAVADAAKKYADTLLDFEGEYAKFLVGRRKEKVDSVRKMLQPTWTKALAKINGLLKDLGDYGRDPSKENFFKIFSKDSNARGYTTACKNWDQLLIEFPDLRDQCFKGKAMQKFFPGMEDYGANWAVAEFESKVNPKTGKTTEAEIYRQHAIIMLKQQNNIKEFKGVIEKLLKLLDA